MSDAESQAQPPGGGGSVPAAAAAATDGAQGEVMNDAVKDEDVRATKVKAMFLPGLEGEVDESSFAEVVGNLQTEVQFGNLPRESRDFDVTQQDGVGIENEQAFTTAETYHDLKPLINPKAEDGGAALE